MAYSWLWADAQQSAPAPGTSASAGTTIINNVKATARAGAVDIEITASAALSPRTSRLTNPDRLVLDFPDTTVPEPGRIDLHRGPVLRVRAAQFSLSPRVARVVIDLGKPSDYKLEKDGSRLVVKVSERASKELPKAKPSAESKGGDSPTVQEFRTATAVMPKSAAAVESKPLRPEEHPKAREPQPESAKTLSPVIRDLVVDRSGGELKLRIALSGPVNPQVETLNHPDRLVLDFPNATPGQLRSPLTINDPRVRAARVSLFKGQPPVTRVVLDLAQARPQPIVSPEGNTVVVRWPAAAATAVPANVTPAATAAVTPAPAVQPAPAAAPVPLPPMRLLRVTAANNLLTVAAEHCTFGDVLREIAAGTGAEVAFASDEVERAFASASQQSVVFKLGPASPRDVVSSFLQGSGFDFIITETERGLETILLTSARSAAGTEPAPAMGTARMAAASATVPASPAGQGVIITSPLPNRTVSGATTLSAVTSGRFVGLQFKVDGENVGPELSAAPYSLRWRTAEVPDGPHSITATARDEQGNTVTGVPVTVTVNNGQLPVQ